MTFATQLQETFTPINGVYEAAAITLALGWAQAFVEDYCNRGEGGFDATTGQVDFIDPLPHSQALIPRIPVTSVTSLQAFMPSQTGGGFTWQTLTNYSFVRETGLIYDTSSLPGVTHTLAGRTWPWLPGSLQVTYDFGFSTIPQSLIYCACRFAQQYLENPALLLSRSIGSGFDERYAGNTGGVGIVINQFDQRIMDRYVLTTIA